MTYVTFTLFIPCIMIYINSGKTNKRTVLQYMFQMCYVLVGLQLCTLLVLPES